MKKFLILLFLFSACQKEIEPECTAPTFLQDIKIIGHIKDGSEDGGSMYIFPLTGIKPISASVDGGLTYYDSCDINGNFSIYGLKAGTYSVCIKDAKGCMSSIYTCILEKR